MIPLFVPTQITPGVTVDADSDSIAPVAGAGGLIGRAVVSRTAVSRRAPAPSAIGATYGAVRSGLNFVQCAPPSVVAVTNCNPASSSRLPCHVVHTSGCDDVVRAFTAGSCAGLTLIHSSPGLVIFTMPLPLANSTFGSRGSGTTVPHSHPGTGFQSSVVIAPWFPLLRVAIAPASCCVA